MPGGRRSSSSPSARRGSSRTAGALRRQWWQRRTTTGLRDSSASNKWPSIDLDGPRRPSTALPWHEKIIHKYLSELQVLHHYKSTMDYNYNKVSKEHHVFFFETEAKDLPHLLIKKGIDFCLLQPSENPPCILLAIRPIGPNLKNQ